MQDHTIIPLNTLTCSPHNVRKTNTDTAESLKELSQSILYHGLLENLIVQPAGDDTYHVIAGGRRLSALQVLVKDGQLEKDAPIPCAIAHEQALGEEISLAENLIRLPMHPLDQLNAFRTLQENGLSVADIAERFGCSERLVRARLRLASVAPEVLDCFRTEKIDMETLKAFTLTEDPERQRAVLEQLGDNNLCEWTVRKALCGDAVRATDRAARFIGLDRYQEAGGTVTQDMFDDDATYLQNPDILHDLVMEKLQTHAAIYHDVASDWKWVKPTLAKYSWQLEKEYFVIPQRTRPMTSEERTTHDALPIGCILLPKCIRAA